MSYWIVDGQKLTNEQYEQLERQKELEKKNIQQESERLSRQLSQAYAALKEHLDRNRALSQEVTDERAIEQQIYYNLRQNLQRANEAPRCVWVREDGTVCGSPRMKNDITLLCPLPDEVRQSGEPGASGADGRERDPAGGDAGATGAD